MRPEEDLTRFSAKDLADQPDAERLLFVTTTVGPMAFKVDRVETSKSIIIGVKGDEDDENAEIVVAFSPQMPWIEIHRDYADMYTVAEFRNQIARDKERRESPPAPKEQPAPPPPQEPMANDLSFEEYMKRMMGGGEGGTK